MEKLKIRLFGQLEVADGGGQRRAVPGRKLQAFLVYLALNMENPPSRDQLAAVFWGERFDVQARQSLRQTVTRLRKALGKGGADILLSNGDKVALNPAAVDVDVVEFEQLAEDGTLGSLAAAADIYRGGLAEGLNARDAAFQEWLALERARLQEVACAMLARLARLQSDAGELEAAIGAARRLLQLDPLFEEAHRLLMRLYAETGERAQALRQYQACSALLMGELGTEPDAETRALRDHLRDGELGAVSAAVPPASQAKVDKPTIAVLPFDDISADKDQEHVANGMTEDIITLLTKYHWLAVISRNSTAVFKGQSHDVRQVADELGSDYVIEGSVRRMGDRIRVTAQLVDAEWGSHIWAERYDRDVQDLFQVQDEIAATIAATIEPELASAEGKRSGRKSTENLDAWDCYHLGLAQLYQFSKKSNLEAQRLLRRAIEIDPDFAAAHARLAYAMILSAVYFDADPTPELLDEALRVARRSAELDDQDAVAHFAVGRVHLARGEYDLSIAELQTSIDLNPSLAQAHCGLGDSLAYAGRLDESVASFDEAVRLSPRDPYRWGFLMYGSMARLFMKQHDDAARWALDAVRVPNSHYWANAVLVSALGHLGRPDDIEPAVRDLLRLKPDFSCGFARDHLFYLKDVSQVDHYVEGLRKAGVPEY